MIAVVGVTRSGTHWLKQRLGAEKAFHCDPGGGWKRGLGMEIHVPLRDPLLSCMSRYAVTGKDDPRVIESCRELVYEVSPHVSGWHPVDGNLVNSARPYSVTLNDIPLSVGALNEAKPWIVPFYQSKGVSLTWAI